MPDRGQILSGGTGPSDWFARLISRPKVQALAARIPVGRRIARRDGEIFAFAGLTDGERFTIVTCVPGRDVEAIHSRMPVILAPEREADWIAPGRQFADCRDLLEPVRPGTLTAVEDQPVQRDLFG